MSEALSFSSESIQPFVQESSDDLRIDLYLKGVRCGHCVHKVEGEVNRHTEIARYQFNSGGKRLTLWSSTQQSFIRVIDQIRSLGFEVIPLNANLLNEPKNDEFKQSLKKLAVAGVCAGNIMLFSTAVYLGADPEFVHFFHKLSLALAIPVMVYSASSIWGGFWKSIRHLKFNLDLPIGLALIMGFSLSLVSFLSGGDAIYFDSLSVVVFLVLGSRMVLNVHLNNIYQQNIVNFIPGVFQIRKITEDGEVLLSPNAIEPKDKVKIYRSETIPVDGRLVSSQAVLDEAVITGESSPVVLRQGDRVHAGSKLCVDSCVVEVEKVGEKTRVGEYIKTASEGIKYSQEESFRLVGLFTLFVLFASFVTFFICLFSFGFGTAFERAFAIVIIACPCAVSFGIPLIRSFTSQLGIKNGIILKQPRLIKNVKRISNICFDKTGTLTQSTVDVNPTDFFKLSIEDQSSLLSLELSMDHPISNGFKKLKKETHQLKAVCQFEYMPGQGIRGQVDGDFWEVLSTQKGGVDSQNGKKIYLYKNSMYVGAVGLHPVFKNGISDFFNSLSKKGKMIIVLSGDEKKHVDSIRDLVPESSRGEFIASATPEEKLNFVKKLGENCLMVGDGVNDAAAMKNAALSVCMPGALEDNMSISDISLTKGDMTTLHRIFELCEKVIGTEKKLFGFTFVYNFSCVLLAAFGYITPVAAAILMPISSITVLSLVSASLRRL